MEPRNSRNLLITETVNRSDQLNPGDTIVTNGERRSHQRNGDTTVLTGGDEETRSHMMQLSESREEAQGRMRPLVNPKKLIVIGNWNVRTLAQGARAAQAARVMNKMNIDILGISESHWIDSGRKVLMSGETIIHSGRDDGVHREGVAIMMSKEAAAALMDWTPVNERIITARFYSNHIKLTMVHVYAPTETYDAPKKNDFYEKLQEVIERIQQRNAHDMLILTGDLNANLGSDNSNYMRIMGTHGMGIMNDNGRRLCELCDLNKLVITGTIFPHKDIHKLTWKHPNGIHKSQIDHIMVNSVFRKSVRDTRVYRSADIASDHYLVCAKIQLKLKKVTKKDNNRKRFNTDKLKTKEIKDRFNLKLRNRFEVLQDDQNDDIDTECDIMEKAYVETAKEVLGYKKKVTKPWIRQETWHLIDQRADIHKSILTTRSERLKKKKESDYREKDREVKRKVQADKKKWIDGIADEAEEAARNQHMKTIYTLTKLLCNDRPKQCTAVKDKDGEIISGKEEILNRWREHFSEVLNRTDPDQPITEDDIGEAEIEEISTEHVSEREVEDAVKKLKNGKAAGIDSITAELLKADVKYTSVKVKKLIDMIWRQETVPKNWKKGLIVKIPKKGDLKECKNWRGITLLPLVSKVLCGIILERIRNGTDKKLRKEQAGFRKGRGTTEQIFILRNIIEQVNEWQSTLYINFIDFEKAFDSIHRDSLWIIMKKYGIPEKIINIIKALYQDFECAVLDNGETTEWFKIKTGVKQGCSMSGFLFLIIVDWIMRRTVRNGETGIRWRFTSKLDDLDFADDLALLSSKREHIQTKSDRIAEEASRVGLKININKSKVMRINARNNDNITINGEALEDVETFVYLGATVGKCGGGTSDIKNRLGKARGAFIKLKNIWKSSRISRKTKIRLFKTLVKPVLMYGCETWKMTKTDAKLIDVFQNRCLRRILKIKWEDKITTFAILQQADIKRLSNDIRQRRWRYIGHILRQDMANDLNTSLTWTPEGRRRRGRPKETWRRTVEHERSVAGYNTWNEARTVAANRNDWRRSVEALCVTWHEEDR